MIHIKGETMKKIDKYLQQAKLYMLEQQINRTIFEELKKKLNDAYNVKI